MLFFCFPLSVVDVYLWHGTPLPWEVSFGQYKEHAVHVQNILKEEHPGTHELRHKASIGEAVWCPHTIACLLGIFICACRDVRRLSTTF